MAQLPDHFNESEAGFTHGADHKANVWSTTKLYEKIPGLWPSSFSHEYCCIYRVPYRLRRVNLEAYTPQMLLIGPLHHSKKAKALELYKTDPRYLDYINMELHKKKYLNSIANTFGDETIERFRNINVRDEKCIRESYSESTDWIKSSEFVEMMLLDSIFILKFFTGVESRNTNTKGDIIFAAPSLITAIFEDLILLENQLPYSLLDSLFEPFFLTIKTEVTFRDLTLRVFNFEGKIGRGVKFRHFRDLFRRVRVETLDLKEERISRVLAETPKNITRLASADKLDSAGVDFVNMYEGSDVSLVIKFERGILFLPCFTADDYTERVMRNLMALEQCHYPLTAYVCNYIAFLDFLIDSEQDVDLLVKKGQLIWDFVIVASVVIVVVTFIGTVTSVLQVTQNDNKSLPSPVPPRVL
ncbi:PREDICTED: UPF0481 protein At3g47200-like [Camelina sativa]|uniref:UPF0481 protein At3g47200-like n=1 Tax=Camelina sativa TaxID=90675 RepID=A0ABM0WES0_CAMSA|nr:PREDICTED: UPF0481 protein At3g47200-like [Camelina sativa]